MATASTSRAAEVWGIGPDARKVEVWGWAPRRQLTVAALQERFLLTALPGRFVTAALSERFALTAQPGRFTLEAL